MPEVAELRVGDRVLTRTWGGDVGWSVVKSARKGQPAEISRPVAIGSKPDRSIGSCVAPLEWITPLGEGEWALNIPPSY